MAKNNRLHNASKQYLNNFKNLSASELLDDEDKLDEIDHQYDQYDDIEETERVKNNQRRKMKNSNY
jgi:hypothetical protein